MAEAWMSEEVARSMRGKKLRMRVSCPPVSPGVSETQSDPVPTNLCRLSIDRNLLDALHDTARPPRLPPV